MSYCKFSKEWFSAEDGVIAKDKFGEKHLVSPNITTIECEDCGEVFIRQEVRHRIDGNGVFVCEYCEENGDYGTCSDCGYWTIDGYTTGDNRYICQDCYDSNYFTCENCGEIYHNDDSIRVSNDAYVCENCIRNYYCCDRCGEYYPLQDTYSIDNGRYCGYCYNEHTVECGECGERVDEDNATWSDEDVCCYCDSCYNGRTNVIHDYGYKPEPYFRGTSSNNEYFGFEIEVNGDRSYAEEFLDRFGDNDESYLYLKKDGSVKGFEIVTQPMSRKFFYDSFIPKLRNGMRFLVNNGFTAHNKAGIHIHVSQDAISVEQMKKLIILLFPKSNKVYQTWLAITQRKDDKMSQWSSMNPNNLYGYNNFIKYAKDEFGYVKSRYSAKRDICKTIAEYDRDYGTKPSLGSGRYLALNCNSSANTVEFRIFNSNTRIERIIKNAQVVFSLLDFTKTDKLPTMNNYLRFIEEHKFEYEELFDFLVEKDIYKPRVMKEKAQKFVEEVGISVRELKEYVDALTNNRNTEVDDNDEREVSQCV